MIFFSNQGHNLLSIHSFKQIILLTLFVRVFCSMSEPLNHKDFFQIHAQPSKYSLQSSYNSLYV